MSATRIISKRSFQLMNRHSSSMIRNPTSIIRTPTVTITNSPTITHRCLSTSIRKQSNIVKVVFQTGTESITCEGRVGLNLLDIAIDNDIDLEGACGGTLACSTCHLYIDENNFKKLPTPEEEEEDMLDLAFGLAENSRLGCQCVLTKELDGITCTLPEETSDARGM
eukprot:m.344773 g.344773  ORF g.344773 m.344773 type:complete len:167 (-) comp25090_c0_seq1:19-519(-)